MAEEGVTYADLRFAKSPAEKGRPAEDPPREEGSDGEGELTYENFPAASGPRQPAGPDPQPTVPGAVGGRVWPVVPLAVLGVCLFLLATCLGLGLRYWQVSRQLEGASRRHTAESGALAQRLGSQEENLTRTLRLLSRAQEELSATSLALRQSREACNSTRWQLEGELEQRKLAQSRLQEEKAQATWELQEARSCQQMGCCPPGWTLFRWKCLRASNERKSWDWSKWLCGDRGAQLLVLKPWDARTFWGATEIKSLLRSDEFWIGLTRKLEWNWEWRWVDGTRYTGSELGAPYNNCATMSQGTLGKLDCYHSSLRYICEKVATPGQSTQMPV